MSDLDMPDILKAWKETDAQGYREYAALMETTQAQLAGEISAALYEEYRAAMTSEASEIALERARNMADIQGKKVATNMVQTELNKLGNEIAQGIVDGKNPIVIEAIKLINRLPKSVNIIVKNISSQSYLYILYFIII